MEAYVENFCRDEVVSYIGVQDIVNMFKLVYPNITFDDLDDKWINDIENDECEISSRDIVVLCNNLINNVLNYIVVLFEANLMDYDKYTSLKISLERKIYLNASNEIYIWIKDTCKRY